MPVILRISDFTASNSTTLRAFVHLRMTEPFRKLRFKFHPPKAKGERRVDVVDVEDENFCNASRTIRSRSADDAIYQKHPTAVELRLELCCRTVELHLFELQQFL